MVVRCSPCDSLLVLYSHQTERRTPLSLDEAKQKFVELLSSVSGDTLMKFISFVDGTVQEHRGKSLYSGSLIVSLHLCTVNFAHEFPDKPRTEELAVSRSRRASVDKNKGRKEEDEDGDYEAEGDFEEFVPKPQSKLQPLAPAQPTQRFPVPPQPKPTPHLVKPQLPKPVLVTDQQDRPTDTMGAYNMTTEQVLSSKSSPLTEIDMRVVLQHPNFC